MGGQCQRQCCGPPTLLKTRLVEHLGARTFSRDEFRQGPTADLGEQPCSGDHGQRRPPPAPHPHHGVAKHRLLCPDGHLMTAKVVREMFMPCYMDRECDRCEMLCERDHSHYICKECDLVYCNRCARQALGLRELNDRGEPLEIQAGDIFLAGPDKYGIHHVILARSAWREVEPDVVELLDLPPGAEMLACDTIESTQGSVGTETWWYKTTTYFTRDHEDGSLYLVADLPPNADVLEQAMQPVRTKILLHPFREDGGELEFDEAAFLKVIESAAARSVRYGKRTAVKSVVNGILHRERIDARSYPTAESRSELATKLKESWKQRPICASVAVMCWQMYFFATSPDKDEAVRRVLRYMPHWCHKSTPSALVNSLTEHGWFISDTADGED
mmetsp:Transcript_23043/g.66157  ORF Transcript_23043/g.66157 Transcript_23043/m.66157 type:complete len:388 (-) Transcript_23043:94-1257(-)